MSIFVNVTVAAAVWARRAPGDLSSLVGDLASLGVTSVLLEDPSTSRPAAGRPWRWDTATAVAHLAATTRDVGLVLTVPSTFTDPWSASRLVGTLDHLTRGRAGWLIDPGEDPVRRARTRPVGPVRVTGRPQERAIELVAAARDLWDGWQEGAFIADKGTGELVDESRIRASEHGGVHFRVAGPATLRRPPSGNPPLFVRAHESLEDSLIRSADILLTEDPTDSSLDRLRGLASPDRNTRILLTVPARPEAHGRTTCSAPRSDWSGRGGLTAWTFG